MNLPRFGKQVSTERIPALLEAAEHAAKQLEQHKEQLSPHMEARELGKIITLYEEAAKKLALADSLADALFSVEMENADYRTVQAQVGKVSTELSSRLLFFTLTIKQWPAERIKHYQKELPQYSMWLHKLGVYAPYTLSEKEERVIIYKDMTGDELLRKLYTMLTGQYMYTLTAEGKTVTVNRGELSQYAMHAKREVRKAASEALLVPFTEDHAVISEIYQGIVNDWENEHLKLRGYKNQIQSRHLANQIPPEVFDALVRVTMKNKDLFRDYVELKRKALGYEEFTRYDFAAPVPGQPEKITYEESRKKVLDTFGRFAPWMRAVAEDLFKHERIDVPPKKGKRSGACCYGMVPGELPLVILNFTGVYDDMFTMAHEFGHAVHDVLAGEKNNDLQYHPPLVLAETASNFAEALLFAEELREASKEVRKALLCQRLDDIMGSVLTQVRITRFELRAHEMLADGASTEDLDTLWTELLKEDFPEIEFPDKSVFWSAIPHIFQSPFYCYSYAFGLLLVLALYQRYEEEGQAFTPKMKALLAAGGSTAPAELLSTLGYDISTEEFWEDAFKVIKKYVNELSTLA